MNRIYHSWNMFLIYPALLFDYLDAPRGDELLDILRQRLELSSPGGRWKTEGFYKHSRWNKLIEAEVELLLMRREGSQSLNEKRNWNLQLLELESSQGHFVAKAYPRRINIEITDHCNLHCPMCTQGYEDLPGANLNISEVMGSIEKYNPYLELVELIGLGEPLTSPDFIEWIMEWPRYESQTFSTTTNGLLLDPQITDTIMESRLNQIRFSVDAVTPESYRLLRGSDGFEGLMKNLKYFMARKRQSGKQMEVWIRMVATRANVHELPEFVRLGYELGVDLVEVMHLFAYSPDMWKRSLIFDRPLWNQVYDEAADVAERLNVRYRFPKKFDLSKPPLADSFTQICREPWEYLFVSSEAKVRACCINLSPMGDLHQDKIESIWNNVHYQQFRKQLYQPDRQYRCQYCYLNFLYADVNNVHSHLIDVRPHYREVGEEDCLHLPEKPVIEEYINACLKGESIPWN